MITILYYDTASHKLIEWVSLKAIWQVLNVDFRNEQFEPFKKHNVIKL